MCSFYGILARFDQKGLLMKDAASPARAPHKHY